MGPNVNLADLTFRILPAALGLVLAAYMAYRVRRMEISYFHVATSWIVALLMLTLSALWVFELVRNSLGGWASDFRVQIDLTFAIFTMWLSIFAISLSTVYGRHLLADDFRAFLRSNPLNSITIWGLIGLVLVIVVWISGLRFESGSLQTNSGVLMTVASYLVGAVAFDALLMTNARAKGETPHLSREERVSAGLLAVAWVVTPFTTFALDVVLGGGIGFDELNPYLWVTVVLLLFLNHSIRASKFTTVVVDSEAETARREGFRSFDIPRGIYLIYDQKVDSALSLFSELVTLPLHPGAEIPEDEESAIGTLEFLIPKGLVVTRVFPDTIREQYGLHVTPIIWLTESVGERRIAPTSLAVLTDSLMRFMETNHNSIVLVEGIEYVVTFNEFRKVLRSLDILNETAWITKARLIIAIDPNAFDDKERALLERDRVVLRGASRIEELKRESRISGTGG